MGVQFLVESIRDLSNVIIPHFYKFPLITQKFADFKLFKQVVEIINRKEHLTMDGLQKIVNLRASINRGLSNKLKQAFSNSFFVPLLLYGIKPFILSSMRRKGTSFLANNSIRAYSNCSEGSSHSLYNPVLSYENADVLKKAIVDDNKGKSGIYKWINLRSGNSYIGGSINLGKRLKSYYSYSHITDSRRNMVIHKALLKYGYSNFKLEILEYCNKDEVLSREQYYLDLLKPEYNSLKIAGSPLGFKHSEETKAKYKEAAKKRVLSDA